MKNYVQRWLPKAYYEECLITDEGNTRSPNSLRVAIKQVKQTDLEN